MYYDVRRRRPKSEETSWKGEILQAYIKTWMIAFCVLFLEVVFIIESVAN
jgi:hypothetical protein